MTGTMAASAAESSPGSRVFSSSLTSRRFPALRTLTAEDVEVMVMEQQKSAAPSPSKAKSPTSPGASSRLFAQDLVKPAATADLVAASSRPAGTGLNPSGATPSPFANAPKADARPPFRPANRFSAREAITLEKTGFVAMYSPFDMGWRQRQRERLEAQKLRVGGTFQPPSATDAKATVGVNYYLNSPDAETIEAERRYIQEKAARNMQAFHRKLRAQQHND